jgi:hypothetical protein
MEYSEINDLQAFLGAGILNSGCGLYLPRFSGKVALAAGPSAPLPLQYAGGTYSERDAKAAFYITLVLGHILGSDKIQIEEASDFTPGSGLAHKTAFLFGSRSNQVTIWATENLPTHKFFSFNFGDMWQIKCSNGSIYEIPDPSKLEQGAYTGQTDYGVIGRLSAPENGEHFFVIAGLGSRATEGCGHYFSHHWRELFQRFADKDFAVILKFSPPLDPQKYEPIEWFGDETN